MKKFVAVAGNIGVGKSTLVELLCNRLGWEPFFEPQAENPYLSDFYQNMEQWAFHSQIFFLTHRLRIHRQIIDRPNAVIQDRCVYEDAEIFAQNLFNQGQIRDRDFKTYWELYQVLSQFLPPPDLVVYLRASVPALQQRIYQRGRDYEKKISGEYIARLNDLYESWVANFNLCPVLTVPTDDLNYVKHPGLLDLVARKIQEKLTGKEEVIFEAEEVENGKLEG
ncbi:MAG: deoxynucleoside kinase [Anaerolineales bacterium]|nr:deoxynucleoside kinase [Anaerolineales bacterium]